MDRQARTGDTVLVKSREMTGRTRTMPLAGGRRGKDDRKQNTLAPLHHARYIHMFSKKVFMKYIFGVQTGRQAGMQMKRIGRKTGSHVR
jgi:hypothetical protein